MLKRALCDAAIALHQSFMADEDTCLAGASLCLSQPAAASPSCWSVCTSTLRIPAPGTSTQELRRLSRGYVPQACLAVNLSQSLHTCCAQALEEGLTSCPLPCLQKPAHACYASMPNNCRCLDQVQVCMISACCTSLLHSVHQRGETFSYMLQGPRWLWSPTLTCACGLCLKL